MTKTNTELRAAARETLSGNWTNIVIATLVFIIISSAVSFIPVIGSIFIGIPLAFCYAILLLNFFRDKNSEGLIEKLFAPLKENYVRTLSISFLVMIYTILWSLLFCIPGIIKAYSYAMTFFISKDRPELTADECINESMKMMNGHKMRLFLLDLSFIGWILLACLTFGIGFFWLQPYMQTARVAFYEDLRNQVR